jgi:branched-chain amino acid transport system ATP-binding protein
MASGVSESSRHSGKALLECREITVRFGGLHALSDVNLAVGEGEVVGIAGPNGAGKTTLFNVISGHVRPARGVVLFEGVPVTGKGPGQIFQLGLARTFQHAQVIGTQRVYTNVLVGAHFSRDRRLSTSLRFDRESFTAADQAVVRFDLSAKSSVLASSASLYERKMMMIASAMAHAPRLLLLDEPVSGLNAAEAQAVLDKVREIRAQGTTVVVIEHVMRVLVSLCDRLVILNRGQLLFDGPPDKARDDAEVQRLYLGPTKVKT